MTARIGGVPAGGAPYPLLRGLRSAGLVTFGPAEDRARRSTMEMKASEGSGAMTMRAVVVYESMYGNTHLIADAIGAGLGTVFDVRVVPVSEASAAVLDGADLVVVGGPTHAHGMSRAGTRKAAVEAADKPASPLKVEPDALGPGRATGEPPWPRASCRAGYKAPGAEQARRHLLGPSPPRS
jgi:hypothetical protein